jgi:hypothetical protein
VAAALALGAYLAIAFAGPRLVGTNPKLLVALFVALLAVLAVWYGASHPRRRPQPTRGPT